VHVVVQDARRRATNTQLLIVLSRLHEAGGRIDELELVVADAASQSECAREKLTYVAGVTPHPAYFVAFTPVDWPRQPRPDTQGYRNSRTREVYRRDRRSGTRRDSSMQT
jgi:hypothetical protein